MKQTILRLVDNARLSALRDAIVAKVEYDAKVAGAATWNKLNPDDGVAGISVNPYTSRAVEDARDRRDVLQGKYEHLEATYAFAVETFIEEEPSDATT